MDEAALQPLTAAFQTLRTWQQRLNVAARTPSSNGHAMAPEPQPNGANAADFVVGVSSGGEFGADLAIHTSRLAADPDAAVLAMCGVSPGSPTGADRCRAESFVLLTACMRIRFPTGLHEGRTQHRGIQQLLDVPIRHGVGKLQLE